MQPVTTSFHTQAAQCEALGSAFTARILRLLAASLAPGSIVADRVLGWPQDPTSRGDALALRLAGGLHALVLLGSDAPLTGLYRAPETVSDAGAQAILAAAMARHPDHLLEWLARAPQTNEVRRSVALIAAGHWLAARFGRDMVLSELGASAGLNLIWDSYALQARGRIYGPMNSPVVLSPDWQGSLPAVREPRIVARAGVDLAPLHPQRDRLRLLSYIWPDQPERLLRTELAAELAAAHAPLITRADAVDWLQTRLATVFAGRLHLVFHTIAWQYFPPGAQRRGSALLAEAGARASPLAPLAHLSMEADGLGEGAALRVQTWPKGEVTVLGRVDFHGRWVDWRADAT